MGTVGGLVKEHSLTLEDAVIVEHKTNGKMNCTSPRWPGWARPAARSGAA